VKATIEMLGFTGFLQTVKVLNRHHLLILQIHGMRGPYQLPEVNLGE
jgi:hypothetical protein